MPALRLTFKKLFFFLIILVLLFPFVFIPKGDVVLMINSMRTPFLDTFFITTSALGNTWAVVFAMVLVLRFRLKWVAAFFYAFAIQILWVLLFKYGFYKGELRPYPYLCQAGFESFINLIEGVKILYRNSFLSGHTATIFFMVSFFALLVPNRAVRWGLIIIGLLVGLSRIYLIHHFYIDVYFGMLFGTLSTAMAYWIVARSPKPWHNQRIRMTLKPLRFELK